MGNARILITGATGFVGRHLVPHLLSQGHDLTLAVREPGACPVAWQDHPSIRVVATGPLETATNLDEAFADAGIVMHAAGLAGRRPSPSMPDPFETANVTATQRLIDAAVQSRITVFIHISSLHAVTHNASATLVDDNSNAGATTPYGRSKRAAEQLVFQLAETGMLAVSLRPPLVVGADARGNWALLQRLAATGLPLPFASVHNRRSLISVDTLARAMAHLASGTWPADKSGNYCLADEESASLPLIVSTLRKGMGLPARLFPFPPAVLHGLARLAGRQKMADGLLGNLEVDSSRFRTTFGFAQDKSLVDSIAESGLKYRQLRNARTKEITG